MTQLTSFLAVMRGGSVTAAADELVVTQPSVSSALAALTRELGCELFERSGRGIRPTAAAQAFLPYATDVIGLLRSGREAAREAAQVAARRLCVAAVTTAAESFVPPLIHAFAERRPGVELALDVGNRRDVLERVLRHLADVAITGTPPDDERLRYEPCAENEIVCITAPDDEAADGMPRPARALADRAWLLREPGSGTRALNERFLSDRGLAPRTLTVGSNGAIKQAVSCGLGISLVSRATVAGDVVAGRLAEIELADGVPARPWYVLVSTVGPRRPVVTEFVEFMRQAAGDGRPSHWAGP
ncbi:MAG: LysR family transcriptional regulator [Solirubrobacterales bacterium]|nr:LysR family transcriptional regulator [Solirubrobacterales bacterium]